MITLENDFLKVAVSPRGAELISLFNKRTQTEHLWQGDPAIWGWHAPNLFPVVGGCLDNRLLVNGREFAMPRHGFARNSDFTETDVSPVHAKLSLRFSEETLAVYPYRFEFQVLYDLFDHKLRISYKVINHDADTIYFSVGGHPAFNVPFSKDGSYDDHYLEFEYPEDLTVHLLSKDGFFTGETEPLPLEDNRLHLSRTLFAKDALVFKNLASRKVTLKNKNGDQHINVSFPHFNYLGLWAKPGADFLCIEPWLGCADTAHVAADIRNKEGIQHVEHGHVFETDYTIAIS